jgi:hypothetical protein
LPFLDLALLGRGAAAPVKPVFVTVPDQAPRPEDADHSHCHPCTAYLFQRWARLLESFGLPLAFVAQNGLEDVEDVPWDEVAAVFIGGDDEFKLGDFVMMDLIPEAKRREKWVHMGRVNGRRLRHAVMADVDSVDGTSMSRFGGTHILPFLEAVMRAEKEKGEMDIRIIELEVESEIYDLAREMTR